MKSLTHRWALGAVVSTAVSTLALGLGLVLPWAARAASEDGRLDREVALVIDTSGSMSSNDSRRYTLQIARLLTDLAEDDDGLTVLRMPRSGSCKDSPDSRLGRRFAGDDRRRFKADLDPFLLFNSGTHLAAPLRTAAAALERAPDNRRLLLVIADSGGLGSCGGVLTPQLTSLRQAGVYSAAVNLGSDAGSFRGNPAFDATYGARHAGELIHAVAQVYQHFLGAKRVLTGTVEITKSGPDGGRIEFDMAPDVRVAYLVTVADGELGQVKPAPGHPTADGVELDFRGGGLTIGLDGVRRMYRLTRLRRPAAGPWHFTVDGAAPGIDAGWMLLQDWAVGVRALNPGRPWLAGQAGRVEVELYDLDNGHRLVSDRGRTLEMTVDGRRVALQDDGRGADLKAGDGIWSAEITAPEDATTTRLPIRLQDELLDKTFHLSFNVAAGWWQVDADLPQTVDVGRPLTLGARLQAVGEPGPKPDRLRITGLGGDIDLLPDSDGLFIGHASAAVQGDFEVEIGPAPDTDAAVSPWRGRLEARGRLDLRTGPALDFGELRAGESAEILLDLRASDIAGRFELRASTDFQADRATLQISPEAIPSPGLDRGEDGSAEDGSTEDTGVSPPWLRLGASSQSLTVSSDRRCFLLRLKIGSCPSAVDGDDTFELVLEGSVIDAAGPRLVVPIRVQVIPESWLVCWWPVLALGFGALATGVGIHGWTTPYRFPPRAGLLLSPEEDLAEGFFHAFRGQKGSRAGFYRDARLYLHTDFRLSRRKAGSIARLRAAPGGVRLRPSMGGLWRRHADGEWSPVEEEEKRIRPGEIYRDASENLYFELRNG